MTTHVIQLDRYCAKAEGVRGRLVLGTWQSYGLEQLQLVLGDGWAGRTVTAVFHGPRASIGTTVLAGSDGLVDVPQEATAAAGRGAITIMGVDADSQRISVDVPYMVIGHAPVTGQQPDPTPDIWQQFIAQTKADADRAEQAAGAASDSAAAAAKSAEAAAESAKQAEQAGADIGAAKDDALEAIQQAQDTGVQAVEGATTTGVQAVQQAHQDAIDDIATDRQQALADIEDVGDKQQSAITSSGAAALEAIGQTEQAAIGQVEQAGTAQVTAVETAGQAQLDKINAANALVPTPTQADAGKAIIVKPDGSGYELGEVQTDAYTKTESDARYAPIAAAIRPTVSGNPATLDHSVAWGMQGLSVYGKSTQVTTTGRNLLPWTPFEAVTRNGVTYECISDGLIKVTGTATATADSPVIDVTGLQLSPGKYCMISTGISRLAPQFVVRKAATGQNWWYSTTSIVIEEGDQPQYFYIIDLAVGVPLDALVYAYLQTGEGPATSDDFEPYSGAVPSPSPTYPQPINTAGASGSIHVTVSDGADESQQLSIQTPNGLPGIPVDFGGNYTDADGQQWVCNEVDFGREVYVQRVQKIASYTDEDIDGPYMSTTGQLSTGATVIYVLSAPIETPLSSEELSAYAALHTYDGTTVVATDAPVAGLSARYVADGAAYIESKIQASLSPVNQAILEAKTNV